jgi:hypothetical protein
MQAHMQGLLYLLQGDLEKWCGSLVTMQIEL